MSAKHLQLSNIFFKYDSLSDFILKDISIQFSAGWTGIVGSNGSGKTTLLKLASGQLTPAEGNVKSSGITYYCEQRTDDRPIGYREFASSFDKHSYKIQNLLDVDLNWFERWDTLSHGERKRCQIAAALFVNPDILVIDEPTNHIDSECRDILINALRSFEGIGLIVSHDRELMNELCHSIVSVEQNKCKMIHGNYDTFEKEIGRQHKHQVTMKENLSKEIKKLEKEVKIRKSKAAESDKRVSKRNVSSKDHDTKSKIDAARLTGKDGVDGKRYSRLKARMHKIIKGRDAIGSTATRELGIKLHSAGVSKAVIIHKKEDKIVLGRDRVLSHPDLYIRRTDKIGLTGSNGCGKSTLINDLASRIPGNISFTYIPQEISLQQSEHVLGAAKDLNSESKGRIFTIISRLNSDPKRLLESVTPSPGEVRKLMLAQALLTSQELIIMDEPTNHMDLPSIKCVENALKEYDGTLILVSHDKIFLDNIVNENWHISTLSDTDYYLQP
jgi:ATPase subunit of ABC transporter with duplicated ATPase domains